MQNDALTEIATEDFRKFLTGIGKTATVVDLAQLKQEVEKEAAEGEKKKEEKKQPMKKQPGGKKKESKKGEEAGKAEEEEYFSLVLFFGETEE